MNVCNTDFFKYTHTAACVNQRPDLFGCAVAEVGVMDMLKFHKFTIGHAWTTDYGCSDNPEQFKWLIKYEKLSHTHTPNYIYIQEYCMLCRLPSDQGGPSPGQFVVIYHLSAADQFEIIYPNKNRPQRLLA